MSDDGQDIAEEIDEDVVGDESSPTSDDVPIEFPADRPVGLPFADADVTDESVADRAAQEEPEVWERHRTPTEPDSYEAADEQLEQIIELPERNADD